MKSGNFPVLTEDIFGELNLTKHLETCTGNTWLQKAATKKLNGDSSECSFY